MSSASTAISASSGCPAFARSAAPRAYMHDGSLATLEDVVKHYSEVSPDRLHSDGTPLVRPLGLSPRGERTDLVAFLRSLDADPPKPPAPPPLCP